MPITRASEESRESSKSCRTASSIVALTCVRVPIVSAYPPTPPAPRSPPRPHRAPPPSPQRSSPARPRRPCAHGARRRGRGARLRASRARGLRWSPSRRPPIPPILQLPVPVHHAHCEVHALERPRDAVLAHGVEDAAAERGVARARGHDTRQDGLDRGHAALPRYSLLAAQSFASACAIFPGTPCHASPAAIGRLHAPQMRSSSL